MLDTLHGKKPPGRSAAGPLAIRTARLWTKALAELLAPLDLAPAQLSVLRELWRQDARTQSELALTLDVEQATMSNTLKRMARDGLIRYEPDPADARARRTCLSDRGRLLEASAKAAQKQVHELAFAGLTRKEQKLFVDLSLRVIAALKGRAAPSTATAADEL